MIFCSCVSTNSFLFLDVLSSVSKKWRSILFCSVCFVIFSSFLNERLNHFVIFFPRCLILFGSYTVSHFLISNTSSVFGCKRFKITFPPSLTPTSTCVNWNPLHTQANLVECNRLVTTNTWSILIVPAPIVRSLSLCATFTDFIRYI